MKLLVLYRPYSEHARSVEDLVHELGRRDPELRVELMNVDGRDGSSMASLYDITSYPGLLALRGDGGAVMSWQGIPLPLMDEISAYMFSSAGN